MDNSSQFLPKWLLIFAAVLCFLAIADLPFGFYRLVRWVACGVAIAAAMQMHINKQVGWVWIFGIIALIFNPLVPFYFPKGVWKLFDAGSGACFLSAFWQARSENSRG